MVTNNQESFVSMKDKINAGVNVLSNDNAQQKSTATIGDLLDVELKGHKNTQRILSSVNKNIKKQTKILGNIGVITQKTSDDETSQTKIAKKKEKTTAREDRLAPETEVSKKSKIKAEIVSLGLSKIGSKLAGSIGSRLKSLGGRLAHKVTNPLSGIPWKLILGGAAIGAGGLATYSFLGKAAHELHQQKINDMKHLNSLKDPYEYGSYAQNILKNVDNPRLEAAVKIAVKNRQKKTGVNYLQLAKRNDAAYSQYDQTRVEASAKGYININMINEAMKAIQANNFPLARKYLKALKKNGGRTTYLETQLGIEEGLHGIKSGATDVVVAAKKLIGIKPTVVGLKHKPDYNKAKVKIVDSYIKELKPSFKSILPQKLGNIPVATNGQQMVSAYMQDKYPALWKKFIESNKIAEGTGDAKSKEKAYKTISESLDKMQSIIKKDDLYISTLSKKATPKLLEYMKKHHLYNQPVSDKGQFIKDPMIAGLKTEQFLLNKNVSPKIQKSVVDWITKKPSIVTPIKGNTTKLNSKLDKVNQTPIVLMKTDGGSTLVEGSTINNSTSTTINNIVQDPSRQLLTDPSMP